MSQITTHILDTSQGKPARGITITLLRQSGNEWKELAAGITNSDGRITELLPKEFVLDRGNYKLHFATAPYFSKDGIESFYPYVEIVFAVSTEEHYHVPLLLTPHGYSTYRGS